MILLFFLLPRPREPINCTSVFGLPSLIIVRRGNAALRGHCGSRNPHRTPPRRKSFNNLSCLHVQVWFFPVAGSWFSHWPPLLWQYPQLLTEERKIFITLEVPNMACYMNCPLKNIKGFDPWWRCSKLMRSLGGQGGKTQPMTSNLLIWLTRPCLMKEKFIKKTKQNISLSPRAKANDL